MSLTKKDLQNIGDLVDTKLDEKLEPVKKNIKRVETKVDLLHNRVTSIEKKLDDLTDFVVPAVGHILEWTDDVHRAIVGKPLKRVSGN